MIRNLVEEHVIAAYNQMQSHFPEFCGCEVCRADVLVYALNRLPARYVASREGKVLTELNLEGDQSRTNIEVTVMEGMRKVSRSPRCGRQGGTAPA